MNIPANISPGTRRVLKRVSDYVDTQEFMDGLTLADGAVPSVADPFPEYTFRWGEITGYGDSSSSSGTTVTSSSNAIVPKGGGSSSSDLPIQGEAYSWVEIERDPENAGAYIRKFVGIEGELPDASRSSNDANNLIKNTAWDITGSAWYVGDVVFLQMVIPGEWWIIGGKSSQSSTPITFVVDCEAGTIFIGPSNPSVPPPPSDPTKPPSSSSATTSSSTSTSTTKPTPGGTGGGGGPPIVIEV